MFDMQAMSQRVELRYKGVDGWSLLTNMDNRESYHRLLEKNLPQEIAGDELRFKQVLINLLKNALKFTRRGFVQVLAGYDESNCQIIVQVADTGTGITAEEIPFLCQKFGKLFRTAEMNSEGVGFGLMISKALIEANGGQLKIASEGINKGSVFQFTMKMQLPVAAANCGSGLLSANQS